MGEPINPFLEKWLGIFGGFTELNKVELYLRAMGAKDTFRAGHKLLKAIFKIKIPWFVAVIPF